MSLFWAVVLFLYYFGILVLAPEYGWSLFGSTTNHLPPDKGLTLGFWRSCMETRRSGIPGPQGTVDPDLNDAAAHYVSIVYGYGFLPRRLRKVWAITVMALVISLYGFCLVLLVNTPGFVRLALLLIMVLLGVISGFLTTGVFVKTRSSGNAWSKRTAALRELLKIQQQPDLNQKLNNASISLRVSSPIWWPYPQDKGRYFQYTWRLVAITMPIAYAVIAFFRANAHLAGSAPLAGGIPVHGVWGTSLILLSLAIEWVLLIAALVWFGDWKGAERSTRVSFPLRILLSDLEDLAG